MFVCILRSWLLELAVVKLKTWDLLRLEDFRLSRPTSLCIEILQVRFSILHIFEIFAEITVFFSNRTKSKTAKYYLVWKQFYCTWCLIITIVCQQTCLKIYIKRLAGSFKTGTYSCRDQGDNMVIAHWVFAGNISLQIAERERKCNTRMSHRCWWNRPTRNRPWRNSKVLHTRRIKKQQEPVSYRLSYSNITSKYRQSACTHELAEYGCIGIGSLLKWTCPRLKD